MVCGHPSGKDTFVMEEKERKETVCQILAYDTPKT